jgi:oligoribonuclease (3'-5' exoribonuclease)
MKEMLVWLDVETTGLDSDFDDLLEIAVCITPIYSFQPIFTLDVPLTFSQDPNILIIDPVVVDMHNATGLWEVCKNSPHNCNTIDQVLAANIQRLGLDTDAVLYPAGSNPGFDYEWCKHFFPRFFNYLSHRKFDVCSLKIAHKIQRGEDPDLSHLAVKPAHRAWNDVVTSMNEAAYFLGMPPVDTGAEDIILMAQHVGKQL